MTEDIRQKEKRLRKELAQAKAQMSLEDNKKEIPRNYDIAGIDARTSHKATHGSSDIPDVILLPKKKRQQKENIPFWGIVLKNILSNRGIRDILSQSNLDPYTDRLVKNKAALDVISKSLEENINEKNFSEFFCLFLYDY